MNYDECDCHTCGDCDTLDLLYSLNAIESDAEFDAAIAELLSM